MSTQMEKSKDDKTNKSTSLFGIVGGLAVGTAVIYGAFRLLKSWTGYGESQDSETTDTDMEAVLSRNAQHGSRLRKGCETVRRERNLNKSLLSYYSDYVVVPPCEIEAADSVVATFRDILSSFLKNHCPKMRFSQIYSPTCHNLHTVHADKYSLTLPLVLDKDLWQTVDAATTLHNNPEYWLIKRINTEFFEAKTCIWDDCCVGDYLSPVKVKRALRAVLQKALIDWTAKYQMKFSLWHIGSDIAVQVEYGNNERIHLQLIPTVIMDNVSMVAKPHPKIATNVTFENLWMQCHVELENYTMGNMDKVDQGCRLMVLKVCKGVYLNHPALQVLDFNVFKTIIFMLNEGQSDWREVKLADRFMDVFQSLENVLRTGYLRIYHGKSRNLIQGCSSSDLENVLCYLNGINSRNKYAMLLETQKY